MLHIIPGESKKEVSVPSTSNDFEGLTKFQADRAKQVKECAGKDHNWNPLFIGANATADTLADRLGVDKHALLTESGDQRLADFIFRLMLCDITVRIFMLLKVRSQKVTIFNRFLIERKILI